MIVIDTHVLVWWANQTSDKLSKTAKSQLHKAEKLDGGIIASAISAWEIAALVAKGRLVLAMDIEDWLDNVASLPGLRFLPIDRYTLVQSTRLPEPFQQDPADRIIVATARGLNFPLITADQQILNYNHVKTIW